MTEESQPPLSEPPAPPARRPAALELASLQQHEDESWILSYVDLFTLLLVMFVVMLTFSSPDEQAPAAARNETEAPLVAESDADEDETTGQDQLRNRFEQQLAGLVERGKVKISSSAAGVTLQLEEEILFGSGAAELVGEGEEVLQELAPSLKRSGQAITVEGHTDDRPIATSRFPSNWELSGARAARVARYLIEQGIPATHISATGYADTRPVADNSSAKGRARNRRVTILVKPAAASR